MSTHEHTLNRILYLVFLGTLFLLALITLEVVVRIRAEHRYGHSTVMELYEIDEPTGLRVPIANTVAKGALTHVRINSLGFRGDDIQLEKPENTIRLAVLGGSTTFCAEVTGNNSTWPAFLETELAKRYSSLNFEVINGGVGGYTTKSSLKNLRHRVMKLEPDIVLVYHAINDIASASKRLALARGLIKNPKKQSKSPLLSFISQKSVAFDLLHKNLAIALARREDDDVHRLSRLGKDDTRVFVANIDSMYQECLRSGIPLFLFTFSTKFRRHQAPEAQAKNMEIVSYYMPWMKRQAIIDAVDLFNQEMVGFAQQKETAFVDTLHDFIPGDDLHFVDSVHLSDRGCQKMSVRVANALSESGLIETLREHLHE